MLKRPITYKNLSEQTVTENFYFNLEIDEVAQLELDMPGGLSNYWVRLIENKEAGKMLRSFKDLIAAAYGERDGDDHFLKETESGYSLGRRFLQHRAYHVLFMELLGPNSADDDFTKFLWSVVPPEVAAKMKENAEGGVSVAGIAAAPSDASVQDIPGREAQGIQDDGDLTEAQPDGYSRAQLLAMTDEQFDATIGTDPRKMDPAVLQVAYERKARRQV